MNTRAVKNMCRALFQADNQQKYLLYLTLYFVVMHLVPFVNVFIGNRIQPFVINDIIASVSVILALIYVSKGLFKHSIKLSALDTCVLLYLVISIFSFVLYFQKSNPASIIAYAYGMHYLVFPVLLYFSVKLMDGTLQLVLLKRICYLNLFFLIVGFILFYYRPEFYTNYLREAFELRGYEELWQLYGRMQSYLGSTGVGNVAWVTLLLMVIVGFSEFKRIVVLPIIIVAALLSQQRTGIAGTAVATVYFMLAKGRLAYYRKIPIYVAGIGLIAGLMVVYQNNQEKISGTMPLIEYTQNRIINEMIVSNPFEDREGYSKGWSVLVDHPLGLGVGANTSAADHGGANPGGQVVDANYMRILTDLGGIGLAVFVMIIIFALRSAFRKDKRIAWILIVILYSMQAIWTNVFDSYYIVHIFWVTLGIIDTKQKKHSYLLEAGHL
ncbi:O-antigen ligase family protein [Gemmatimonadota bacterium]